MPHRQESPKVMSAASHRWDIVFSMMHRLEAEMWAKGVCEFQKRGLKVGMLIFDESAREVAQAHGIDTVSVFELLDSTPYREMTASEQKRWLDELDVGNVRFMYIHERLGYGRTNEDAMLRKSLHLLQALDAFFSANRARCVVQETGGFAACNAVYYAARRHGIDHVFYEPAPFAKRVVFTLNDTYARIPKFERGLPADAAHHAAKLRDAYLSNPAYVVPAKDKHSFRDMTVGRMFNAFNARRLASKLYRKYVTREREEFNEIGFVVRKNLLKLLRRRLLSAWYTDTDGSLGEKYIYYPFHVPHDLQLSVRSKLFYNQEAFVDYLCRILPNGYRLYVKEHPASIGGHSYLALRRLLRSHKNLRLIHPRHGSFPLVRHAACVITVNSKVGFEAVMQGKKVVVAGEAFYKREGVTFDVENVNELEGLLQRFLDETPPDRHRVLEFLSRVYAWTYPCDLFDLSDENCAAAFGSLRRFLGANGIAIGAEATQVDHVA